ncbi:B12-binding domain-containing radical SAM protein [Chloroflexota bacterium]
MKIVLIQPRVGHNTSYIHEPLGLGYIAAFLILNGFKDVEIHIAAFEADREIVSEAARAELVGFTATSPMMKHAKALARQIKQANTKIVIAFGGAHPTSLPENTLEDKNINLVIRGEGEETIREVAQAIEKGESFSEVKGISYRNGNKVIHCPDRGLIPDIDALPFPARNLMNQRKFLEIGYKKYGDRGAWIFSSRGCPYKCTYCASWRIWTRKWRARSPQNIIKEIKGIVNDFDVDRINFADDTFTISKKRVIEFCELLGREGLGIPWGCNVRADSVDKELLETMRSAGCTDVWIGAESGSPLILDDIKKGIILPQIENAFKWSKEAGLKRRAYLMIGSRRESKETILQTEELVERARPDTLEFSILTPYPGSDDYERAKRGGYISEDVDWSGINLFSSALIDTQYLTRDEVKGERARLAGKYKDYLRI